MLDQLLECQATDPESARRGRWLNRLLLSFLVIIIPVIVVDAVLPHFPLAPGLPVNTAAWFGVLLSYFLSRRGYVMPAILMLLITLTGTILGLTLVVNLGLTAALTFPFYFAVVVGTAGIFLGGRAVLGVVGCLVAIGLLYYTTNPTVAAYQAQDPYGIAILAFSLVILFAGTGALSWLSSRMIGETLLDLQRRNQELEGAYLDLARQMTREHQVGGQIGNLAAELANVSTRQVAGVLTQAESVSQVVSAVTELHNTAEHIAVLAGTVRAAATDAVTGVGQAQALLEQSRTAIARNREQVGQVLMRMTTLEKLAGEINEFIQSIQELSEETHLLALNATIEAAGAGSMGRRFSVVAAEVQHLAGRASEVVEQIQESLAALQAASTQARDTTQQGMRVADEVEALADEVREKLTGAVKAVQQTSDLQQQIATATRQQTLAAQQVTATMQQIAAVAETNRTDSHALGSATSALTDAAELLNQALQDLQNLPGRRLPRVSV
jgi:methyl-accepting chemotaxis protein